MIFGPSFLDLSWSATITITIEPEKACLVALTYALRNRYCCLYQTPLPLERRAQHMGSTLAMRSSLLELSRSS